MGVQNRGSVWLAHIGGLGSSLKIELRSSCPHFPHPSTAANTPFLILFYFIYIFNWSTYFNIRKYITDMSMVMALMGLGNWLLVCTLKSDVCLWLTAVLSMPSQLCFFFFLFIFENTNLCSPFSWTTHVSTAPPTPFLIYLLSHFPSI